MAGGRMREWTALTRLHSHTLGDAFSGRLLTVNVRIVTTASCSEIDTSSTVYI